MPVYCCCVYSCIISFKRMPIMCLETHINHFNNKKCQNNEKKTISTKIIFHLKRVVNVKQNENYVCIWQKWLLLHILMLYLWSCRTLIHNFACLTLNIRWNVTNILSFVIFFFYFSVLFQFKLNAFIFIRYGKP